jgi:DNA-directed RNA polymerase subunit RPC12/RpoP
MLRERVCPQCGSRRVRYSHKVGLLERFLLPLFSLRPYRCEDCDSRFFGPSIHTRARADSDSK